MRILLDVDGVIADFIGAYMSTYEDMGGRVPDDWAWTEWDAMSTLPDQDIAEMVWQHPDLFRRPRLFEGARKQIAYLNDNHAVVFVTAVPHRHIEARSNWFKRVLPFIHRKTQIVFTPNKHFISGDVLVEDNPGNLAAWILYNPDGLGILIRGTHNKNPGFLFAGSRYVSVDNMKEAVTAINIFNGIES
jgi:5'(3')-deoxyribonucleotidase